jgi:hypothetical protein
MPGLGEAALGSAKNSIFQPAKQYPGHPHVQFSAFPASDPYNQGVIKSGKFRRIQRTYACSGAISG